MRTSVPQQYRPERKITPEEALTTSGAEAATTVVRAALSTIPLVGSPVSELFNAIMSPNLAKRREGFLTDLYYDLRKLEERVDGFRSEILAENDQFVSIAIRASQAALKDHRNEKQEALRHAVLNTGIGIAIDEDVQMLLIDLVDTLTPLHLRLLKFLNDPKSFPKHTNSTPRVLGSNDGFFTAIEDAFLELQGKRYLYVPLLNDLYVRGLSHINMQNADELVLIGFQMSSNVVQPKNTWLGSQLLQYVATPAPLHDQAETASAAKANGEATEE